jgi:hypothetical protein
MIFKKRGLGRGLEALLADESAKEESLHADKLEDYQLASDVTQDQIPFIGTEPHSAMVIGLFKNIQRENHILLEEAESLRQLIADFEAIIRDEQS